MTCLTSAGGWEYVFVLHCGHEVVCCTGPPMIARPFERLLLR